MSNLTREEYRTDPCELVSWPREFVAYGIVWDVDGDGNLDTTTARWSDDWHQCYIEEETFAFLQSVMAAVGQLREEPKGGQPVPLEFATLIDAIYGESIRDMMDGGAS